MCHNNAPFARIDLAEARAAAFQAVFDDDEPPDREPPVRRGPGSKYSRDHRLTGVIRRRNKYEARIAGGRGGLWIYLGLFATIDEAIQARRRALAQRQAA